MIDDGGSETVRDDRVRDDRARAIASDPDADLHVDPEMALDPPSWATESPPAWRAAKALLTLRGQIDAAYPGRGTASDGLVGDPSHQSRASDHNPWIIDGGVGVVSAFDVTHDPAKGCDAGRIAEALRQSRDRRIKYIIWNRRIANASPIGAAAAWTWRTYTGTNPHNHHCHLSVKPDRALYDDPSAWTMPSPGTESIEGVSTDVGEETVFADLGNALSALGGAADRPLIERLVEAQDAIGVLLSRYNEAVREPQVEDMIEAARPDFASLKDNYAALYARCELDQAHIGEIAFHRGKLLKFKPRYDEVAAATGAPWWFIGIVHALEASFNFAGHLHNGDPLGARTVQVPKGRPLVWNPPSDWASSAIDVLTLSGYAGRSDWGLLVSLYRLEGYNGFGYQRRGVPSPYLWSFSNNYVRGKFVKDGVFDPNAVSRQCGAAVIIKALEKAGDIDLG